MSRNSYGPIDFNTDIGIWRIMSENELRSGDFTEENEPFSLFETWLKDAEGSAREVIKYVTKDILPDRQLISSELFARVYEAIDGRRMSQPSSGLFKGTEGEATCACGAAGCFRRSSTPPADHNEGHGDE